MYYICVEDSLLSQYLEKNENKIGYLRYIKTNTKFLFSAHFANLGHSYYCLDHKNITIESSGQRLKEHFFICFSNKTRNIIHPIKGFNDCNVGRINNIIKNILFSELGKKVKPGDGIEIEGKGDLIGVKMSGKLVHIEERRTKRLKKKDILTKFLASFIPGPYIDICGASERSYLIPISFFQ